MKLETPIVRVFRGETWLTVYRSVALGERLSEKKCHFENKICLKYSETTAVSEIKFDIKY